MDLLTWLMDEANVDESTDEALTTRLLTVNFAAIHTSSMVRGLNRNSLTRRTHAQKPNYRHSLTHCIA